MGRARHVRDRPTHAVLLARASKNDPSMASEYFDNRRRRSAAEIQRVTNPRWIFAIATSTVAACSLQADLGGEVQPIGGQLAGLTPGETITLEDNVGDLLTL